MEVHFNPELEAKLAYCAARQGVALVEAMQASPYKDLALEPKRDRLPVRDTVL
ncbi:MAG: hypothetical protein ABSC05_36130 [Candidatus Solibacter sp.]|jgi:hypothetical protein